MKGEIQNSVQKGSRWLRVGVLTLTMAGPIVNTLLKRLLQRSQSLRERPGSTFWALFGFSLGLVGAAVVTYLFIRRRMIQEEAEQSQPIELPPDQELYVAEMSRPAGEILHL